MHLTYPPLTLPLPPPLAPRPQVRDLEIVMVNSLSPFGNGHLLPRGTLRELPKAALRRADAVVLHHADLAGGSVVRGRAGGRVGG